MIKIINGDLLTSSEYYIFHQTNCISAYAAGIARNIFEKFPDTDVYKNRTTPSKPGTIEVIQSKIFPCYTVINAFGQYNPGKPNENSTIDNSKVRKKYFHKCLLATAKIPNLISIGFPFGVGCGLAGGNLDHYYEMIENFANYVYKQQGTLVRIYKL